MFRLLIILNFIIYSVFYHLTKTNCKFTTQQDEKDDHDDKEDESDSAKEDESDSAKDDDDEPKHVCINCLKFYAICFNIIVASHDGLLLMSCIDHVLKYPFLLILSIFLIKCFL